jgi:hypothetical protein
MRNFRRTRKRGGVQYTPNVFACRPREGVQRCAQRFASSLGLQIVETADDGNCFYDSLSKYGARTGNAATNKTHLELRREVVTYMINHRAEFTPALIPDNPNAPVPTNAEILAQLRTYLRPYTWAGALGDVFPQVAARVLNINITIYDITAGGRINKIAMGNAAEGEPDPARPVIQLLRTNGNHFRLLVPKPPNAAAAAAPQGRRVTAKKANVIGNTAAALAKVRLSNRKKSPSPKPAPTGRYALRSRTTNKKPANAGPGKSPSPPPTTTRRRPKVAPNSENKNLAIALKAINKMEKAEAAKKLAEEKRAEASAAAEARQLQKALKAIRNLEAKEAAAAKKAMAKETLSKPRTSSLENALTKIALQESEEQEKKNKQRRKQLNNNFFKALEDANF